MNRVCKIGVLSVAFFFAACSGEKEVAQQTQTPPMPVSVSEAKMGDIPVSLDFSGQIVSQMDVRVRAKVTGTIEKQFFKAGQSVKEGDKLYQIDKAKYQAAYDSARANFVNADLDYKRAKSLFEADAISQKEYDSARAAYGTTLAAMNMAKIDLDYSTVTAPFSGVVGDTLKDVGSYVSVAEELVRLTEIDPVFVKFAISDTDKLDIAQKTDDGEWEIKSTNATMIFKGEEHNGTLSFIDNVIDEATGSVNAKVRFDNSDRKLTPGAFAKITVSGFVQKNGFKIPQIAIFQEAAGPYVYLFKDGKVAKTHIKIVLQDATTAIISSGLNDGDLIIVDNFKKIQEGQAVQIANDTAK